VTPISLQRIRWDEQQGPVRTVMTPPIAADHPPAWIRNREQGDWIVT